ncbi:MAG TPA: adenylyltransferase/cytidyltransferase family protein [Candidatus Norongarragalinales archaeon]|nr:adenylyltransferase/cytidyltransferase family protein [Candidatus Norongarragalinales archaeon]
MTRVLLAGAFDFLHPGHLDLFRQAKSLGPELIVVVARDSSVERIKGKKPLFSEIERLQVVSSVKYVDQAVLGSRTDFMDVLLEFNPDVLLLGYDQAMDEESVSQYVRDHDLKTHVLRAKAYKPHQFKSSKIKDLLGV